MAQHGFTTKEGENKWHDSKSEEVYDEIKKVEERDASEGQEALSHNQGFWVEIGFIYEPGKKQPLF
ncbi:hypothetical protein REPUB_Repub07fG0158000 [Reevesia pubescens]